MKRLLAIFLILNYSCTMDKLPDNLIIAHRGVPYFAPEATAPAYLLARDLGAHYLEVDLQRSKDGVLLAVHDNNLLRTTNVTENYPNRAQDYVDQFTWDELQQLDAGSWFNKEYPSLARENYVGLKILSLEELIDIAEAGTKPVGLYIETKHPEQFPGIEEDLKLLLQKRGWYQTKLENGLPKVVLQSFSPESVELLRKNFPKTPINYLLWSGAGCLTKPDKEHLTNCLDFAEAHQVEYIGPSFYGELTNYNNLLEPWFIELVRERNFKIHAYTFDTETDILTYTPLTDGQFTNRTDLQLDYYKMPHQPVEDILTTAGY